MSTANNNHTQAMQQHLPKAVHSVTSVAMQMHCSGRIRQKTGHSCSGKPANPNGPHNMSCTSSTASLSFTSSSSRE